MAESGSLLIETGLYVPEEVKARVRPRRSHAHALRKYFAEFIYGGIDGGVTTFAVVAAATGGGLSNRVIIILGIANLLADGFAMSIGAYLSAKTNDHSSGDTTITSARKHPVRIGLATFLAFFLMGSLPLLWYAGDQLFGGTSDPFFWSCVITGLGFLGLGALKARVVGGNGWKCATETLLLGSMAAVLAFYVGDLVEYFVKV